jgi:hypothetical protein
MIQQPEQIVNRSGFIQAGIKGSWSMWGMGKIHEDRLGLRPNICWAGPGEILKFSPC